MLACSIVMPAAAATLLLLATSAAVTKSQRQAAVAKSLLLAAMTQVAAVIVIIVVIAVTACLAVITLATAPALQYASQYVHPFVRQFANRPAAKLIPVVAVIAVIMVCSIIAVITALSALRRVILAATPLRAAVAACKPSCRLEVKPSRRAIDEIKNLKQRTAAPFQKEDRRFALDEDFRPI